MNNKQNDIYCILCIKSVKLGGDGVQGQEKRQWLKEILAVKANFTSGSVLVVDSYLLYASWGVREALKKIRPKKLKIFNFKGGG